MFRAIGVIELKNVPKGVEATDDALKSAGVDVVSAHPSCPGKYEIILTGSISNVTASVSHVLSKFDGYVIDSSIMGRIDEQVITALFGTQKTERKGSLGLIETFSVQRRLRRRTWRSRRQRWKFSTCAYPVVWAARASFY